MVPGQVVWRLGQCSAAIAGAGQAPEAEGGPPGGQARGQAAGEISASVRYSRGRTSAFFGFLGGNEISTEEDKKMIHSVESSMERPTMILWVLIATLLLP